MKRSRMEKIKKKRLCKVSKMKKIAMFSIMTRNFEGAAILKEVK